MISKTQKDWSMKVYPSNVKIYDILGIIFRKRGNFIVVCGRKVFFSLSTYHFSRA